MKNLFSMVKSLRAFHSCESAFYELISFLNEKKNKKLIALLLFIEKAFDLVDSDLLIKNLFHYGLSNESLELIKNYFFNNKKEKLKTHFLRIGQLIVVYQLKFSEIFLSPGIIVEKFFNLTKSLIY